MVAVTRWYWLRHAPLAASALGRIHGAGEAPVDLPAPMRAARIARALPEGMRLVASPLARARDTASVLRPDLTAQIEPGFIEQDFGLWEGRVHAEIEAAEPEAYAAFWRQPARARPPGGERYADVIARVAATVDRISAEADTRPVVVVAHAGVVRAALAQALGLTPEQSISFVVDPLSLTRIDRIQMDDGAVLWRVETVNRPLPTGEDEPC